MAKYVKRQIKVNAIQWLKDGDHPNVRVDNLNLLDRVWGCFGEICKYCNRNKSEHGVLYTLEGWHIVCPSDYIITGINGEMYPCKEDEFLKTYDKVEQDFDEPCDHIWKWKENMFPYGDSMYVCEKCGNVISETAFNLAKFPVNKY